MKKLIGFMIIIAVFGVSLYLLLKIPKPGNATIITKESNSIQSSSEEWLGIFLQGQHIGYSFTIISRTDTGLIIENRSQMTLIMMNTQRSVMTHIFCNTDKDYALKDFVMDIQTQGHESRA